MKAAVLLAATCAALLQPERTVEEPTRAAWNAVSDLGDHTWVIQGQWKNGAPFLQELSYAWSMDSTILSVRTLDAYTGPAPGLTLRSEGVRAMDNERGIVRFWEFDHLGGITEGTIDLVDGALHFNYDYRLEDGVSRLTDAWIPLGPGSYAYKVGVYRNGEWSRVFLEGRISQR